MADVRPCELFRKALEFAAACDRRMIVKKHAVRIAAFAALEGHRNDLAAFGVTRLADNAMSGPRLADIERAHPFQPIRKLKHFGIGQALACIVVASLPVLLHSAP